MADQTLDDVRISMVDIADLKENPDNAREHNPKNIGVIVDSVQYAGAGRSGLIDEENVLIAGHGTKEAMMEAGIRDVVVVDVPGDKWVAVRRHGLTKAQKIQLAIADNRATDLSEFDRESLGRVLGELRDLDAVALDALRFTGAEFNRFGIAPQAGQTDPDDVPEVVDVRVAVGDLWQLGRHRIICGDCLDLDVVRRVLNYQKADMVFTDPPYNIAYGTSKNPRWRSRPIENDEMSAEDWVAFCEAVANIIKASTDHCVYVCHAPGPDGRVMGQVLDKAMHCSTTVIWNKDVITLGRGKYQNKYEPIWFGWVENGSKFCDDRTLPNVWDVVRPKVSDEHPTMKPVELVTLAIVHASNERDVIFDPFSGSGTTIIACEQTNRMAAAVEIDPRYVQVTIDRWEQFTEQKAVKL